MQLFNVIMNVLAFIIFCASWSFLRVEGLSCRVCSGAHYECDPDEEGELKDCSTESFGKSCQFLYTVGKFTRRCYGQADTSCDNDDPHFMSCVCNTDDCNLDSLSCPCDSPMGIDFGKKMTTLPTTNGGGSIAKNNWNVFSVLSLLPLILMSFL